MTNPPRAKPIVTDQCPIFRNDRLFLGYVGNREAWLGCMSHDTASREGVEHRLDWYQIWLSETPDADEEILDHARACSIDEDKNIERLADQYIKDEGVLRRLPPEGRVKRYARLLEDINLKKINVRKDSISMDFDVVPKHFLPRARPGNKGILSPTGGLGSSGSARKRGRVEADEEGADGAKKRKMSNNGSIDNNATDCGDLCMGYGDDDQDDEEVFPYPPDEQNETKFEGETGLEQVNMEEPPVQQELSAQQETPAQQEVQEEPPTQQDPPAQQNSPAQHDSPFQHDTPIQHDTPFQQEPTVLQGDRLSRADSMMQLKDALSKLYWNDFAFGMRQRINKLESEAKETHRNSYALDIPSVLVSFGTKVLELFHESVERATSAMHALEDFVDFVGVAGVSEEAKKAPEESIVALATYTDIVVHDATQVQLAIEEAQRHLGEEVQKHLGEEEL